MNRERTELTEESPFESLEVRYEQVYKIALQKTLQSYPLCSCGNTRYVDYDYDFAPRKKGITVKVMICACGKRNFPFVEMVH